MIVVLAALLATPLAAAPVAWTPDTIPWQQTNPDGTCFALLEGVRNQASVPFTYAFFIPSGVWDGPHSHAATARVVAAAVAPVAATAAAFDAGTYTERSASGRCA